MSASCWHAGAPPGQNRDAQGWRALGVKEMTGAHVFHGRNVTAAYQCWRIHLACGRARWDRRMFWAEAAPV